MRLLDFNLSTADLRPHLQLYWEQPEKNQAVIDLLVHERQLWLVTGQGQPLTLDQFQTRVRALPGTASMFIQQTPPVPLFGYRLVEQQLLLG